jgi:tetratricopeptide (TPR) repeat protein
MAEATQRKLREAVALTRQGRPADAIPVLDDIIATDPECTVAWKERGYAKLFTRDYPGAIADFTEVTRQWPSKPDGFTCRAQVHAKAGDLRLAIDDYSNAIGVKPRHPTAFLHRGRLKVEIGDLRGAIEDFTSAIEFSDSGPLSGLLNRGRTYHAMGEIDLALIDLTEAIRHERFSPIHASLARGRVRLSMQDWKGAIDDFSAAINCFPRLSNAYGLRAEARTHLGDADGARDDLAEYERLGGRDLPAYD